MKIGIISDTHGNIPFTKAALDLIGDADHIIHCGDVLPCSSKYGDGFDPKGLANILAPLKNISYVRGNGDFFSQQLMPASIFHDHLLLELGGYRIFATHSHLFRSRMSMLMKAMEAEANILCYGHTHSKELDFYDNLLVLNPGSVSLPRDGSNSCAIIEDGCIRIFDLVSGQSLADLNI